MSSSQVNLISNFLSVVVKERVLFDVRAKKDLAFLSTDFILYHANEQLRLNKKLRVLFEETPIDKLSKSSAYETVIKNIRAKARKPYAIFQIPSLVQRRDDLLRAAKLSEAKKMNELLESHLSTKERVATYAAFFDLATRIVGEHKVILDLACGLNPIAFFHFVNSDLTKYICNEMSDLDCDQLNCFFDNNKMSAKAVSFDLVRQFDRLDSAPFNSEFDVCFLLKALDTLESQKLYVTYDVLKRIKARWIIASFPIQSMSGKKMKRNIQINWFEKMLPRLGLKFEHHELGNEVFYFCSKA